MRGRALRQPVGSVAWLPPLKSRLRGQPGELAPERRPELQPEPEVQDAAGEPAANVGVIKTRAKEPGKDRLWALAPELKHPAPESQANGFLWNVRG